MTVYATLPSAGQLSDNLKMPNASDMTVYTPKPKICGVAKAAPMDAVVLLWASTRDAAPTRQAHLHPHAMQLLCHESLERLMDIQSRVDCRVWKTIRLPAPKR